MFAVGQKVTVNDAADMFMHGKTVTITDIAVYPHCTILTVVDARNWSFAIRAEKAVA